MKNKKRLLALGLAAVMTAGTLAIAEAAEIPGHPAVRAAKSR